MAHMTITNRLNNEQEITCDTHRHTPQLTFLREIVEERSGGGDHLDAITIEVVDSVTGKKTRFFVDVHINKGRVCLHAATNVGVGTNFKRLFGEWR